MSMVLLGWGKMMSRWSSVGHSEFVLGRASVDGEFACFAVCSWGEVSFA